MTERPPAEFAPCDECGQVHARLVNGTWRATCPKHVRREWDPETRQRVRRERPRPCLRLTGEQAVCHTHGANKFSKAKAVRTVGERKARSLAAKWAVPVNTTPTEAILDRIGAFAGHVAFYRGMVEREGAVAMAFGVTREKESEDGEEGAKRETISEAKRSVWLDLYNEASELLVKFSAEALRIGIEQSRVRLAQQMGETWNALLRSILGDLQLTDAQQALVPDATVRHLRMISGGAA